MTRPIRLEDVVRKVARWDNIPNGAVISINYSAFRSTMLDPSEAPIMVDDRKIKERYDQLHALGILVPNRTPRSMQELHRRIVSTWDVKKVHALLEMSE